MRRGRNWAVSLSALLGLWMLAFAGNLRAETVLRIWHPPLKEPYKALVDDIVTGASMELGYGAELLWPMSPVLPVEVEDIETWEPGDEPGIVLTSPLLESLSTERLFGTSKVAGLAFDLKNLPGISLNIDQDTWIRRVKEVAPRVRDVFFVGRFPKDIDLSNHEGLNVYWVKSNVLGALDEYAQLRGSGGSGGAVAIVFSPIELSKYPSEYIEQLTKVAWEEQWILASGRADLLQRGFTLALVPDYVEYGRQLVREFAKNQPVVKRHSNASSIGGVRRQLNPLRRKTSLPAKATSLLVSVRAARRAKLDTRGPALRKFDGVRR